jgi:hypothetical protein
MVKKVDYIISKISGSYFRFKDEGDYIRVIPVKAAIRSHHRSVKL